MKEVHLCRPNVGENVVDLVEWLGAGLNEVGFAMSMSATQFRAGIPNIIFEHHNDGFKTILDRSGSALKLICFVTEIIEGEKFNDSHGLWDGRERFKAFMSIADHYAGFITTVPTNVERLAHIAPATFFEFGYSDALEADSPDDGWLYDFSLLGHSTLHRRDFLSAVTPWVERQGRPHMFAPTILPIDQYKDITARTAINICLKHHPEWPIPSPTRLARIAHLGVGCAVQRTKQETRQSLLFPRFDDAADFIEKFGGLSREQIRRDALERRSIYRKTLPLKTEIVRNLAECPALAS